MWPIDSFLLAEDDRAWISILSTLAAMIPCFLAVYLGFRKLPYDFFSMEEYYLVSDCYLLIDLSNYLFFSPLGL